MLDLLGVSLGFEGRIKDPRALNPTGLWEVGALTALNERILETLGGGWSCPPPLEPGWSAADGLDDLRREAATLTEEVAELPFWCWKDPRACITWELWADVLRRRPVFVVTHRNPVEVAQSLTQRDGLSTALGLALWERYTRAALAAAAGRPTFVLAYERLLAEPGTVAGELAAFLTEHEVPVTLAALDEIRAFVDPALHRQRAQPPDPAHIPVITSAQLALRAALERSAGAHRACALAPPEPESPWVEPLLAERRAAGVRAAMNEELAAREERTQELRDKLARVRSRNETLQAKVEALQAKRGRRGNRKDRRGNGDSMADGEDPDRAEGEEGARRRDPGPA